MNDKEPLLKDEEEQLACLMEDKKKKEKKGINWVVVRTIIASILVLWFFIDSAIAFYIGFANFDLHYKTNEDNTKLVEETEKELSLSDNLVTTNYEKINFSYNTVTTKTLNNLYKDYIDVNFLDNEILVNIILSNLGMNREKNTLSIDKVTWDESASKIFNREVSFSDIESLKVEANESNETYTLTYTYDEATKDFIIKKLSKATMKDDELYLYEKFAYFKFVSENKYEVYGSMNLDNPIMTYIDDEGNRKFDNEEVLKTYKYTFKKSNGNYGLFSINAL